MGQKGPVRLGEKKSQKTCNLFSHPLIPCYSVITTRLWGLLEITMTRLQFDNAFDQGQYEDEYSQWLADHFDCNAHQLEKMAERFESYEDFRDDMMVAA